MDKKKVMVVDDEETFTHIVKLNLEETGLYEVLTLSGAKDIISHLHAFQPDVVMLDLVMPGIGGMEACEMLNKDTLGQKVPIIILSALNDDIDKLRAYKLGVVDYLSKPVDMKKLLATLDKALRFK